MLEICANMRVLYVVGVYMHENTHISGKLCRNVNVIESCLI